MSINKIGFDYDVTAKTNVVMNASGCYIPPLTPEQIAYRKTFRYKAGQYWYRCWLGQRLRRFAYRLKCIW